MNPVPSLNDDVRTIKRIQFALRKSKETDQTANMDLAASNFRYEACDRENWNPERFSLMYGTPIWDQATPEQRVKLNQLYWTAYYAQITSAEIATIFFNQTAAAALYGIEDFRPVCDTLDLESAQERAHINAFRKISGIMENALFGERILSFAMRGPFVKTMLYSDLGRMKQWMRRQQLRAYTLLSSNSAFIGCQYFTVRGLRTLNGKIVQHQLSRHYTSHADRESANIPAKVSYYHFVDESYHFNTSTVVSHDVVNSIRAPNRFEATVANMALLGCQRDHYHFSTAINGIFWYDPAMFDMIYRVLRSPTFALEKEQALELMERSFCHENEGMLASFATHREAVESYQNYLADFKYVSRANKDMSVMASNTLARHLAVNRLEFRRFRARAHG